jgi:hypothetical protein
MATRESAEVQAWSPRSRTLSVYVDERLELVIEALRDSIPLRSKAEGRPPGNRGGHRAHARISGGVPPG